MKKYSLERIKRIKNIIYGVIFLVGILIGALLHYAFEMNNTLLIVIVILTILVLIPIIFTYCKRLF